jgi:hypothetical protein
MCFDNANLQPQSVLQTTNKPAFDDAKQALFCRKPFADKAFTKILI